MKSVGGNEKAKEDNGSRNGPNDEMALGNVDGSVFAGKRQSSFQFIYSAILPFNCIKNALC